MFHEVLLELGISSLIRWPVRIAELIEGDILDTLLERGTEPLIDESGTSLDRICGCTCECDEVDGVIVDIVETGESRDRSSLAIDEPLSHLVRSK